MTQIRSILMAAAGAAALAAPAKAQPPMSPNTAAMGPDFVKTAAATDEYERQAGALAVQRSRMPQVREFARQMIAAHTKSSQDLGAAARSAGIQPPPAQLNPGQQRLLQELRDAPPADFDKIYLQQQHEAHADAMGLMKTYAMVGKEPPLRMAAAKTEPVVRQHLTMVVSMQRGFH
jgi:putative membrane protein